MPGQNCLILISICTTCNASAIFYIPPSATFFRFSPARRFSPSSLTSAPHNILCESARGDAFIAAKKEFPSNLCETRAGDTPRSAGQSDFQSPRTSTDWMTDWLRREEDRAPFLIRTKPMPTLGAAQKIKMWLCGCVLTKKERVHE